MFARVRTCSLFVTTCLIHGHLFLGQTTGHDPRRTRIGLLLIGVPRPPSAALIWRPRTRQHRQTRQVGLRELGRQHCGWRLRVRWRDWRLTSCLACAPCARFLGLVLRCLFVCELARLALALLTSLPTRLGLLLGGLALLALFLEALALAPSSSTLA